jgi:hypothetical protein
MLLGSLLPQANRGTAWSSSGEDVSSPHTARTRFGLHWRNSSVHVEDLLAATSGQLVQRAQRQQLLGFAGVLQRPGREGGKGLAEGLARRRVLRPAAVSVATPSPFRGTRSSTILSPSRQPALRHDAGLVELFPNGIEVRCSVDPARAKLRQLRQRLARRTVLGFADGSLWLGRSPGCSEASGRRPSPSFRSRKRGPRR